MEEIQPTRKDIIKDLRNWALYFLEVRNEHLGGMPACPFVGAEVDKGKLMIAKFDPSKETILDKAKELNTKDVG